jgi:hypothetical protein
MDDSRLFVRHPPYSPPVREGRTIARTARASEVTYEMTTTL